MQYIAICCYSYSFITITAWLMINVTDKLNTLIVLKLKIESILSIYIYTTNYIEMKKGCVGVGLIPDGKGISIRQVYTSSL